MTVIHDPACKCRDCTLRRNEPRTSTCDCCGRRRLCQKVAGIAMRTWSPDYCIKECLALSSEERAAKHDEMREQRSARKNPPLAWPIIGGPLDGKYAVPADFYRYGSDPGMYAEFAPAYEEFNCASGGYRRIGASPTMIFVFEELLKPMIRGRDR